LGTLEENKSFAVGHLAFGYISGKASAKILKANLNIPLVLALSVIPDVDILIPILKHRGPTHSILMASIVFIPIFAIYRKKATPYFIALIQHSLIGDYIAGGRIQLLWPATSKFYGLELSIKSQTNIIIEWIMFLTSTIILLKTKDAATLFQPRYSNLTLSIPTFTVLLPALLSFPIEVPTWLIPPHLAYLFLFLICMIINLSKLLMYNHSQRTHKQKMKK